MTQATPADRHHPLRQPSASLAATLASRGLASVAPVKRWLPWKWVAQRALYLNLDYIPSPAQLEFHQSRARVRVLCAGARFGKSMVAARDLLPVVLSPGTHTWIVGPTYDLAEKEWRYLVNDLETLGFMRFAKVAQLGKPGYIEFEWGARIWTRSADNPSSLLGEEVDAMLISEASQLSGRVWSRYLRARIGSRLGRVLIPTTPSGYNWVRDEWARGDAQARGELAALSWAETAQSWQCSVLENPHYDPQEYLAAQATMPAEEFAEQFDGRFTSMSGRILPAFRTRTHTLPAANLPGDLHGLPVFRTIDFGFSNPSVCLWCAFDAHGLAYRDRDGVERKMPPRSWWVVSELYRRQMLTEQLAAEIKANPWTIDHRIVCTIGDMADAQARATLARHGVPCAEDTSRLLSGAGSDGQKVPIDKAWDAGIRTLRALYHQGRVMVSDACVNVIRENLEATFADDGKDRQTPGQDDHALDAQRYLAHTLTPT